MYVHDHNQNLLLKWTNSPKLTETECSVIDFTLMYVKSTFAQTLTTNFYYKLNSHFHVTVRI
jgi:hypothetical protein